jgi:hypothetical protein
MMGYTTEFEGEFEFSRELTEEEAAVLHAFSEERHGGNTKAYPGFPGFWCNWTPTHDRRGLEWNGMEKFYDYVPWLNHLITKFFIPWDVQLSGQVRYRGENFADMGIIKVKDNRIILTAFDA